VDKSPRQKGTMAMAMSNLFSPFLNHLNLMWAVSHSTVKLDLVMHHAHLDAMVPNK